MPPRAVAAEAVGRLRGTEVPQGRVCHTVPSPCIARKLITRPLTSSHPQRSCYFQHFSPSPPTELLRPREAGASSGKEPAPRRSALPWSSYTSRQSPVCFQHNGLLIIFAYPLYECYQTVRQLPSQPASSESVSK